MKINLWLLLLLPCVIAYSQDMRKYEHRANGFEYIEIVKGTDNGKLPLLIAFHYSGGSPDETISDYEVLRNPVRIILPKGNNRKRGGFSYYPAAYYQKDSLSQFKTARLVVDSIAKFVQTMSEKYGQKPVVSGISQGGDIAFLLARYYPELLKASFPFAAVINSQTIKGLKNYPVTQIPVYIFQGENDEIVNVAYTRACIDKIAKHMNIVLQTYPGLGHDISDQMKADYSKRIDAINED